MFCRRRASSTKTACPSLLWSSATQFGHRDARGGLTLAPDTVRSILVRSATDHACPDPRRFHYPDPTLPSDYKGTVKFCEGTPEFNGFYGNGIVDALRAVS